MDGDVSALIPTLSTLAIFIGASLVLLLTPGPAVVYIAARGIGQGWRAGVTSALAVGGGNFVHALAATAGLSALLVASAEAFTIVKWAGARIWPGLVSGHSSGVIRSPRKRHPPSNHFPGLPVRGSWLLC